ncbi:cystathionine beta-lyase [bacterium (Candidatus Blackallbacteria) CG17_big_fil_post_rev_8_21_14_2_50_48_46]|uniref:Cystathionine beta-lyase n=1 Tax=bacterium (Candidatus Blackallbacteria) CG17_big_fil_post_rev_8_21_14_2_50_48_46 TaxID=2014261 RepID=A0A2M7G654_9BACT|nr:MAG: cystathionine beta-lyase [bacterium (Candidatus Blackallbacteria) CG18_big_fil_WC_8_21_14_2_50_49_26]PIW17501.1 MAG: cystathionine beta-lyase [bacterium (Candidatus Blackallbacteria) CG17_big_fil_post_rev_8_21_14_2_50_48_46]PIW48355.1 MAG: cystathionine beta-lyase [bacterium (Candidatus Blackallbacteria) CG13_big_fil_rev_8_21_14_2_50_49_14]
MTFEPASEIQDYLVFGEYGEVNPSINDSSTYTFLNPATMEALFDHEIEGCFLYSRHWNPSNKYLAQALAAMENTESAQVTSSGMGAIGCTLLQLCQQGDEIIASRTIYGGTYALLKNFLPRLGIQTKFVNIHNREEVEAAITPQTKLIYGESISNPLLEFANIPALAELAHAHGLKLVIDNTFSPLMLSPVRLGADIVLHSLTKFINGTSDCVAGAVCGPKNLIDELSNVNHGATMLLGPVLDSFRSASILKNLHSLHIRIQKHSANALMLAQALQEWGIKVHYPGLESHPDHALLSSLMNPGYGYGGMLVMDAGDTQTANQLMERMQQEKVGYLAVSLGYFKTLFSAPGHSTSSEIPPDERQKMGLSDGMVRISVGLDYDMARTLERIKTCLQDVGLLKK